MHFDLRFWEESMAPPDIVKKALPLLSKYDAGVAVAMYPVSLTRKNANALAKLKEAAVDVAFWPLLEHEQGYFAYEGNVNEFAGLVRHQLEWAEKNGVMPDMVAVDLEMPIHQMRLVTQTHNPLEKIACIVSSAKANLDRERYHKAKAVLDALNCELQDRGVRTLTAVLPWVGIEMESDAELLQDMTETPASGIGWDVVSPMLYVSMLAGMSAGAFSIKDANWIVYDNCSKLRAKYGGRSGVSLGLTGGGVLEEEPVFEVPAELLVGLGAALAAGIRDVSIYSLKGIIDRKDPEEWFEAIRSARPKVPDRSRRIADLLTATRFVYPKVAKVIDWYRRA